MSDTQALPGYVAALQVAYGAPSEAGFGSAVFFEPRVAADDLETSARDKYRRFMGKNWIADANWLRVWQCVYSREAASHHDVVAELRSLADPGVQSSVTMILDAIDNPASARQALVAAMDDPAVAQLQVFVLGDGEALSGLLIAAWRETGEATFLVFLLD